VKITKSEQSKLRITMEGDDAKTALEGLGKALIQASMALETGAYSITGGGMHVRAIDVACDCRTYGDSTHRETCASQRPEKKTSFYAELETGEYED
jgi:hypothetical protein